MKELTLQQTEDVNGAWVAAAIALALVVAAAIYSSKLE